MKESIFIQFVKALWPKLNLYVKEKETPKKRTYLFKTMLRKVYSPDQKWEGTSAKTTYVAADMVAMDSPLPIKSRPTVATSNGKLPKVGMKKKLQETDINNINIMKAHLALATTEEAKATERRRIFAKLADDGTACSVGIDEKTEMNFLSGLSNGVILVEDEDNTGTGLRVKFGYLPANTFGTITKGELSREDFENVNDKADADGNTIIKVMMAKSKLGEIRRTRWAKELAADYSEKTYTDETNLPVPSVKSFTAAFEEEFGYAIETVDRTVVTEKNGKKKNVKPWNKDRLVFLCQEEVGSLVYGTLAEATNQVQGVQYATIDDYKLISRYSHNEPSLEEVTSGQALVLPVIEDVDQIYVIDCSESKSAEVDTEAEAQDVGDVYVTVNGVKYNKQELIAQLKTYGASVKTNSSDATVIAAYNALSDEQEAELKANLNPAV